MSCTDFNYSNNIEFLEYLGTLVDKGVTKYKFKRRGITEIVLKDEALRLVKQYDSKHRNCKVSKGNIVFKVGEGVNTPEYIKAKVINIVTPKYYKKMPDIWDNSLEFIKTMQDINFMKENESLIYCIDESEIVNYTTMEIKTAYGVTSILNLSTGLKVLLNILHLKKYSTNFCINISECGENILPFIFETVCNTSITLFTSHDFCYSDENYLYIIDGHKTTDLFYLIRRID